MKKRWCVLSVLTILLLSTVSRAGSAALPDPMSPQYLTYNSLVIGVPDEAVGGTTFAGAINTLYNSGKGLYARGSQFWNQGTAGVGQLSTDAFFGETLAVGDFNGDGHDDLAIGAYNATINASIPQSGAVYVLYSNGHGLSTVGRDIWTQDSSGVPGITESDDMFGYALAAGNFNGDGYDDLAIGVPYEAVGSLAGAGAVNVLYGSASGLTGTNSQLWDQDSTGINGTAEKDDYFGYTLAAGDFDHNGYDDLAIGAWQEDVNGVSNAGSINVLYSNSSGLTSIGNQLWTQDDDYVAGVAQTNGYFSLSMAVGNYNGDSYDDLAVGAPGDSVDAIHDGAICELLGSSSGLAGDSTLYIGQSAMVSPGGANGDSFGSAMVAADFSHDGKDDLAVGTPNRTLGGVTSMGVVYILKGTSSGIRSGNSQTISEAWAGEVNQANDEFGVSLATGHFNADGYADLAIGVPGKSIGSASVAGMVIVLGSDSDGSINPSVLSQSWSQDSPGVPDLAENSDQFGMSLAVGNFGRPYGNFLPILQH